MTRRGSKRQTWIRTSRLSVTKSPSLDAGWEADHGEVEDVHVGQAFQEPVALGVGRLVHHFLAEPQEDRQERLLWMRI